MFQAQFHLVSGEAIGAELDELEVRQLIADLLAVPSVVPDVLESRPSEEQLEDREGQLQLVAIALGESLRQQGTLHFLSEHARSVIVQTDSVAGIEVFDPDAPAHEHQASRIASRPLVAAGMD